MGENPAQQAKIYTIPSPEKSPLQASFVAAAIAVVSTF